MPSALNGGEERICVVLGAALLAALAIAYAAWRSMQRHARLRDTLARVARYRDEQTTNAITPVTLIIEAAGLVGPAAIDTLTPEETTRIDYLLDEWTEIALGIRLEVYDEAILFALYGGSARFFWSHLRPFITQRRGSTGRELAWAEFERLAVRWLIRMHSVDRDHTVAQLKTISAMLDQTLGR